jgi:hypothetical protein
MNKRIFLIVVGALMVFTGALSGCLPSNIGTPTAEANQATRAAAATAQAELNLLQNEAYELEKDLDANFSEHYVGIQVESYPNLKVIVYLTGADKADLAPFVENPGLFEVIEVREEEISRQTLRATREILTVEMDKAGVTYTTGIKMEPARLEVYVYDIPEAQDLLKTAGVAIPEHVEFIEMDTLPEGG